MRSHAPFALVALLLAGCLDQEASPWEEAPDGDSNGDTDKADSETGDLGIPDYACDATRSALAFGDVSALGFSGDDVILALGGSFSSTLVWTLGGGTTALELGLAAGASVEWVDREPASGTGYDTGDDDTDTTDTASDTDTDTATDTDTTDTDTETTDTGTDTGAEVPCADYLSLDVVLAVATADGAFAESVAGTMIAYDLESAWFDASMDYAALQGDWVSVDLDGEDWDSSSVGFQGETRASRATSGEVTVSASREEEGGVGIAMQGFVARWPDGATDTTGTDTGTGG